MKKIIIAIILVLGMAGSAWGAGYHATGLTSADSRCSFAAGDSWLAWDALDFSAYADGNWFIRLVDSSGYVAEGYAGSVGTGETLGIEQVADGGFNNWIGDDPDDWGMLGLPEDGANYVTENPSGVANIISDGTKAIGISQSALTIPQYTLGHITFDMTINAHGYRRYFPCIGLSYANLTTAGAITIYGINQGDSGLYFYRLAVCNYELDNVSLKQITEPAATGIHILNGPSGSEAWAKIDSGFDYNYIVEISIIPNATLTGVTLTGVSTQ